MFCIIKWRFTNNSTSENCHHLDLKYYCRCSECSYENQSLIKKKGQWKRDKRDNEKLPQYQWKIKINFCYQIISCRANSWNTRGKSKRHDAWIFFLIAATSRWQSLHRKLSFPLRISPVNVTKSVGNWTNHIYWRNF